MLPAAARGRIVGANRRKPVVPAERRFLRR